jgi:hypothetical protein
MLSCQINASHLKSREDRASTIHRPLQRVRFDFLVILCVAVAMPAALDLIAPYPGNLSMASMLTSFPLIPLLAIAATIGWIVFIHRQERSVRERLGASVREFATHRRWMLVSMTALALLLFSVPITEIIRGTILHLPVGGYLQEVLRVLWIGGMIYANRRNSIFMVGDAGFARGGKPLIPWSDVGSIDWDRDIGQRQWGVTIAVRRGTDIERQRFYFRREMKDDIELTMSRFRAAAGHSGGLDLPAGVARA